MEELRNEEIIPDIPTQPVGYDDAKKFLEALPSSPVEEGWQGNIIGLTYNYGGPLPNRKYVTSVSAVK